MVRPLLLVLLCLGTSVMAQDYEREARWRSEVLGNLVVGDAVQIAGPAGRKFLGLHAEGAKGKPAIVLVHGLGVHPDHGVIGMLRVALNDMGFTTLSIQMPVLAADAAGEAYEPLVPEAVARIATAAGLAGRQGARAHRARLAQPGEPLCSRDGEDGGLRRLDMLGAGRRSGRCGGAAAARARRLWGPGQRGGAGLGAGAASSDGTDPRVAPGAHSNWPRPTGTYASLSCVGPACIIVRSPWPLASRRPRAIGS